MLLVTSLGNIAYNPDLPISADNNIYYIGYNYRVTKINERTINENEN